MKKMYFTTAELINYGFIPVEDDGGESYYQFIFDKGDYFNSDYISTISVSPDEFEFVNDWSVINPSIIGEKYLDKENLERLIGW